VKTIDVKASDLDKVLAILDHHLPGREVRAFGSRVAGKAKPFSDLDLVVLGADPLAATELADVREAFRESDLPFKVDVVEWATTRDSFRRIIEREFVLVRGEGGARVDEESLAAAGSEDHPADREEGDRLLANATPAMASAGQGIPRLCKPRWTIV